MASRRSYLETLNAGRERRPAASFDQLNRSLANLEERLRTPGADERFAAPLETARPHPETAWDAQGDPRGPDQRQGQNGRTVQSMVRDIERARSQEEGFSAAGRIAGELKNLREEFLSHDTAQRKLTQDMQGGFDALRHDIDKAPRIDAELAAEFDRLSAAIQTLSERGGDRNVSVLRQELEQVRHALDQLAREDSLRSVASRWDAFEERLGDFEAKIADTRRDNGGDEAIAGLDARLDGIARAVSSFPTQNAMKGFEDNLQTLAQAVDQFARGCEGMEPAALRSIDARMEELARALSTAAREPAPVDPRPFDRIEARLSAVSRQMEEWRAEGPSEAVVQRLSQLASRVDELAAKANLPGKAVEQLGQQVAIIAAKLDRVGEVQNPDFVFRGIEQRFETLAGLLERRQGDASQRADMLFRDLERRLDEVVERLDTPSAFDPVEQTRAVAAALDARFEDFARRFESRAQASSAAADPMLIRSLEEQVRVLTEHLSRPSAHEAEIEAIAPRLDSLERSLSAQHGRVVEAAREAAERAVRGFAGSSVDKDAVSGLTQDLKSLEALSRRSDERNAKTFEAIHDTLVKIVDRLGTLEPGFAAAPPLPEDRPSKIAIADAPSLDLDRSLPPEMLPVRSRDNGASRSPVQAAAEAAMDAVAEDEPGRAAPRKRSMLGGLTRVLGRGKGEAEAAEAPFEPPPPLDLDEPLDPKLANRPLEPGSGAPDLGAIMRRVRDERAQTPRGASEADAAKSDFIAAARRAAQAAASEAEIVKRQPSGGSAKDGGTLGSMLRRKTLLLAVGAIMMALAGLQVAKPFLSGSEAEVAQETTAPAPEPAVADAGGALPAPILASAPVAAPAPVQVASAADVPAPMPAVAAPEQPPVDMAEPAPAPAAAEAQAPALEVPAAIEPAALREAAADGDAKALWEVGTHLASGRDVPVDEAAAAKWFEAAAELGLAPAQYRVGSLYEKGNGVARDTEKAKSWYLKAAEAGNVSAMHNLAVLHAMGVSGAADNASAARWFAKAAAYGVKDSQFNLGILSAKGVGMARDLEEAYKWFSLVAQTGDKDAAAKRDDVAKALSPEQMKRATGETELWKAKPVDAEANTVEIPDSWEGGEAPATTASVDMKAAVRTIQLILEKNGYEPGGTDGVMGARTKAAIVAFQKDNDLPPSGEVDDKLVKALLARK